MGHFFFIFFISLNSSQIQQYIAYLIFVLSESERTKQEIDLFQSLLDCSLYGHEQRNICKMLRSQSYVEVSQSGLNISLKKLIEVLSKRDAYINAKAECIYKNESHKFSVQNKQILVSEEQCFAGRPPRALQY